MATFERHCKMALVMMRVDRALRAAARATATTGRCRSAQPAPSLSALLSSNSRPPAPPAASAIHENVDGDMAPGTSEDLRTDAARPAINVQLPTSALLLPSANPNWQVVRPEHFRVRFVHRIRRLLSRNTNDLLLSTSQRRRTGTSGSRSCRRASACNSGT